MRDKVFEEKIKQPGGIRQYFFPEGSQALSAEKKNELGELYSVAGSMIRQKGGGRLLASFLKDISLGELKLLNKSDNRTLLMDIVLSGAFNHEQVNEVLNSILINPQEADDSGLKKYINTRDTLGRSVLTCALTSGNGPIVERLLGLGAKWDDKDTNALLRSGNSTLIEPVLEKLAFDDKKKLVKKMKQFLTSGDLLKQIENTRDKVDMFSSQISETTKTISTLQKKQAYSANDIRKDLTDSINSYQLKLPAAYAVAKVATLKHELRALNENEGEYVKNYKETKQTEISAETNHLHILSEQLELAKSQIQGLSQMPGAIISAVNNNGGFTEADDHKKQVDAFVVKTIDSSISAGDKEVIFDEMRVDKKQVKDILVANFKAELAANGSAETEEMKTNQYNMLDCYLKNDGKYGQHLFKPRLKWMGSAKSASLTSGRLHTINTHLAKTDPDLFLRYWICKRGEYSVVQRHVKENASSGETRLTQTDVDEFLTKNQDNANVKNIQKDLDVVLNSIKRMGF